MTHAPQLPPSFQESSFRKHTLRTLTIALTLWLSSLANACDAPTPVDPTPYQVADTAEPPMPARELLFEWAKGELPEDQLPLAVAITEGMSERQLAQVQQDAHYMVIERLCAGEAASLEPYLDTTLLSTTASQELPGIISAATAALYLDALHSQGDSPTARDLRDRLWAVIDRAEPAFTVNHQGCQRDRYLHLQALGATGAVGSCESHNLMYDSLPGEWRSYLWHAAELISHQPDALDPPRLLAMLDGFEAATTAEVEHYERLSMARALMRIAQHLDDPGWEAALLKWSGEAYDEELAFEMEWVQTLCEYPPRHIAGLRELGHDDHARRLALRTASALEDSWPGTEHEHWKYHRMERGRHSIADLAVHLIQLDEPERGWGLLDAQLNDLEWELQEMKAGRGGGVSNEYHCPWDAPTEGLRFTAQVLHTLGDKERAVQTMGASAQVWVSCKTTLVPGAFAPYRTPTDAELLMDWMDSRQAPDFDARELHMMLRAFPLNGGDGRSVGDIQGMNPEFWRRWQDWVKRLPEGSIRTDLLAMTTGHQAVWGSMEAVPTLLELTLDEVLPIIEQGGPRHYDPEFHQLNDSHIHPWKGIRWALEYLVVHDPAQARLALERLKASIVKSSSPDIAVFAAIQIGMPTHKHWSEGRMALLEAAETHLDALESQELRHHLEQQLQSQCSGEVE